jgi:hypothetical protein
MRKPLEPRFGKRRWECLGTSVGELPIRNGKRGTVVERRLATGRGNPLKAKAQGRYRHETRPERLQMEQSVKRVRNPEGVAQPGSESLV